MCQYNRCTQALDFYANMVYAYSMIKRTKSMSSTVLADVARRCIERELMTRHADMLNAANEDSISDRWFISDRH